MSLVCALNAAVSGQTTQRKIAYNYGGSTASRIAVINEDGAGNLHVTSDGFTDGYPDWSPDGSQITFHSNRYAGRYNILRMNADGTGLVPITDFSLPHSSTDPSWSPDGTKIVFVFSRENVRGSELWVMNADGSNQTRLTTLVQLSSDGFGPVYSLDLEPDWSPDGSKVAFRSNRDGIANPEIYSINVDGTNLTRLTNNSSEDKDPAWSPDGSQIAFFSRGNARDGIYAMDTSGANERRIVTTGFQPNWSPDGSKLVFTDFDLQNNSVYTLYLVNADGTNRTRLTKNGPVDSLGGAWQTTGGPAPPPPPSAPLFSVTGRVVDQSLGPNGPGVSGVVIRLSGTLTATTTTDGNGNFAIGNLPENGNFTLTPSSESWGLSPTSISFATSYPFVGFVGRNYNAQFSASPIFLEFITGSYNGHEGSNISITVVRSGYITGTSTIDYATTPGGTATAGVDYVATTGTLQFKPFESQKSFTVPVVYDRTPEPNETINLTLSNPTGSTARGRQTAVLTISDPPPALIRETCCSSAVALNADTWVRDPFSLTTSSFLGQDRQTRVAFFVRFLDLMPGEGIEAIKVNGFNSQGGTFQLPVESISPVPAVAGLDGITQVIVRLPSNLTSGALFVSVNLRGLEGEPLGIRIK